MNKQNKIAWMKILPIVIMVLLIVTAGYFLLGKDLISKLPFFEKRNTLEMKRLSGFPTEVNVSNANIEKQRSVITSEKELIDFLSYLDKTSSLTIGDKIDFNKQILIGVSSESFDNDGFSVKIRKIYTDREKNKLLVSVKVSQPGDNCPKLTQPAVGVDIVAVDKTNMVLDFETLRETTICKEQ